MSEREREREIRGETNKGMRRGKKEEEKLDECLSDIPITSHSCVSFDWSTLGGRRP